MLLDEVDALHPVFVFCCCGFIIAGVDCLAWLKRQKAMKLKPVKNNRTVGWFPDRVAHTVKINSESQKHEGVLRYRVGKQSCTYTMGLISMASITTLKLQYSDKTY